MEQFGDRREQIERTSDNDIFSGYSASKTNFEFTHKLGYLTQHSLTDIENEQSVVYWKKKREEDFNENQSSFQEEFCPDRESQFNVDFEEIQMSGTKKKNQKYRFIYDTNILNAPAESFGENIKNSTIDENDNEDIILDDDDL